jgi:hypothetical protein
MTSRSRYVQRCANTLYYSTSRRPTVVVALGGNALLRDREALTGTNMAKNVTVACEAIASIVHRANVVLTYGNGPHVGLLDGQQRGLFELDVVDAETQGMIGYVLEEHLRNVLPTSTPIAAMLTQVEVDRNDPAFQAPTKPIGPFYDTDPSGTMAKIDGSMIVDFFCYHLSQLIQFRISSCCRISKSASYYRVGYNQSTHCRWNISHLWRRFLSLSSLHSYVCF